MEEDNITLRLKVMNIPLVSLVLCVSFFFIIQIDIYLRWAFVLIIMVAVFSPLYLSQSFQVCIDKTKQSITSIGNGSKEYDKADIGNLSLVTLKLGYNKANFLFFKYRLYVIDVPDAFSLEKNRVGPLESAHLMTLIKEAIRYESKDYTKYAKIVIVMYNVLFAIGLFVGLMLYYGLNV